MPTNASTPYKPKITAAQPRRETFDPWNTSSKGHQHAENRLSGSTSWRDSRTYKLNEQFGAGISGGGGRRIADLVGAGSAEFGLDGRTDTGWDDSVRGWRGREGIKGVGDVGLLITRTGKGMKTDGKDRKPDDLKREWNDDSETESLIPPPSAQVPIDEDGSDDEQEDQDQESKHENENHPTDLFPSKTKAYSSTSASIPTKMGTLQNLQQQQHLNYHQKEEEQATALAPSETELNLPSPRDPVPISVSTTSATHTRPPSKPAQIFTSLTILINGSTYPTISDHRLKHLLTLHGARLSLSHARRQVTHVIVGRAIGVGVGSKPVSIPSVSCGGGLASSKLHREITKTSSGRGLSKGVRYVSVEWATESIKAGVRLPESRFPGVYTAPAGVRGVADWGIGGTNWRDRERKG